MEEDSGAKAAPVTRLRRRLSVEQTDDAKSPAPATPTKKRGRLAAKPQLELIDEDAIQNSPKRTTRKSLARDLTEPDERPVTPARRNTRAKSNTSLVSEPDEKTLTPSRRSTRIKSNTSIVLETTLSVESPRAKRAATRRNSQAGSDTETPITPARTRRARQASTSSIDKEVTPNSDETNIVAGRTRRTRRGSTSSIDVSATPNINETTLTTGRSRRTRKGSTSSIDISVDASPADNTTTIINEVISEEPETYLHKSSSNIETDIEKNNDGENRDESPSLRKSPRLMAKKGRKSNSTEASENNEDTNKSSINDKEKPSEEENTTPLATEEKQTLIIEHNKSSSENDLLSISSVNLIKNLESMPKYKKSDKNKSLPDISLSDSDIKSKRHRTKSWANACATPPNEGTFYSDNESTKKKLKKHGKLFKDERLSETGSGDGPKDTSSKQDTEMEVELNTSKKNRKSIKNSPVVDNKKHKQMNNSQLEVEMNDLDSSYDSNKENVVSTTPIYKESSIEALSKTSKFGEIQSLTFLEDSDSNTGSINKQNNRKQVDGEDQCVPVILDTTVNQVTSKESVFSTDDNITEQVTSNVSCEPMDIDETLPNSFTEFTKENEIDISLNKSKRKSSVSNFLEKSNNSNKSLQIDRHEKSLSKQSRKSSLCLPQEESPFKNKRKSAHSVSEIVEKNTSVVSNQSISKHHRKSSLSMQDDGEVKENLNESKRKSGKQDLEKSSNENKSTLVLSQLKDVSAAESSVTKSPHITNVLSKSLNGLENEGPVNKNLTVNYSTSTPVQKKNMEKLAIQMNTSVITPTIEKQKNNTSKQKVNKKRTKKSSDEETNESEDETSHEKSNLFIAEAEDAGDDYESGDSQNEDEREYEKENEIVEKGETLTSDEEFSDDSDYEKDSFIVSSDEEDNELLSGSGDDLDMSDNELTMSTKSKKKFNDRKEKQQKKASREMFEARHGDTKKDKSVKDKKNSRLRLDSTLLESDNENKMIPSKKNKRMRLESTMDSTQAKSDTEDLDKANNTGVSIENSFVNKKKKTKRLSESTEEKSDSENVNKNKNTTGVTEEDSFVHKKKNTKRLSESICNYDVDNEIEISINNKTVVEEDPLILAVKSEPKTPQKELEISTIHFTDRKEIEQVAVDENTSIMKINDTTDPLHNNENSDDDADDESISENEEISNNYESMLKELNKESKKQIKSHDISLNLDKKAKKVKQTLVDELNLTQTKVKKGHDSSQVNEKSVKRMIKKLANDEESSSDSINLKLIFSDDSSEKSSNNGTGVEVEDHFIPLKKSKGKTDIPGSKDVDTSTLNLSANKKQKRKSTNISIKDDDIECVSEELPFFIDTKGDLADNEVTTNVENEKSFAATNEDSDEGPAEVSYVSEKSHKRKKKLSVNGESNISHIEEVLDLTKTPETEKKNKKKKSKALDDSVTGENPVLLTPASQKKKTESQESQFDIPFEVSSIPTPGSKKKSKKFAKSQEDIQDIAEHEISIIKSPKSNELSNLETSSNKKKDKRKSSLTSKDELENSLVDQYETESISRHNETETSNIEKPRDKKRKRKSSANKSTDEITIESMHQQCESQSGNEKKKIKTSNSDDYNVQSIGTLLQNSAEGVNSKKHKHTESVEKSDSLKSGNKKRKERDDDEPLNKAKVLKSNSLDKIHVPRLPDTIIKQLEDKPVKVRKIHKVKATSTTEFLVEQAITKRTKPSNFLEETVYLNDDEDQISAASKKAAIKKPKVLPFLPTVSISDSGFTTNFQVNVISQKMEFVAKKNEVSNFKNEYLENKKLKKLRTYDLYKKQRNMKLTKF